LKSGNIAIWWKQRKDVLPTVAREANTSQPVLP
jgi:hypothetical protein